MSTSKAIATLQLPGFPIYTRASYFQKFGKPAPPADPTKRAKAWIGSGSFSFLQGMALVVQTVPQAENDVNIEGSGPYPAFALAPTKASPNGANGLPYNPLYLSLEADARALMQALGGANLADEGANGMLTYPADEPRREWEFDMPNGVKINAGAMIFIRNMGGVGSPGHWNVTGASPIWVPDPSRTPDLTQPAWGPPCRALAPNESIGPTGIFGDPTLIVDDGTADPSTSTTAVGYDLQDRNRDNAMADMVKRILVEGLRLPLTPP